MNKITEKERLKAISRQASLKRSIMSNQNRLEGNYSEVIKRVIKKRDKKAKRRIRRNHILYIRQMKRRRKAIQKKQDSTTIKVKAISSQISELQQQADSKNDCWQTSKLLLKVLLLKSQRNQLLTINNQ